VREDLAETAEDLVEIDGRVHRAPLSVIIRVALVVLVLTMAGLPSPGDAFSTLLCRVRMRRLP
jgi:hypothetical protein